MQSALEDAANTYTSRVAKPEQQGLIGAQQMNAPVTSAKPKSVIQNGHTYILNEATGEYE